MRTIDSLNEPRTYVEWRARYQTDINFGYDLIDSQMRTVILSSLIGDQRGLCAYTGIGIDANHSHIEHLIPQDYCGRGVGDVAYSNMAACYPQPGHLYIPFGAVKKGNWPSPAESHLFVSPRSSNCESRFRFNLRGQILVSDKDLAAAETVQRLGLNHTRLEQIRKEAINATLRWSGRTQMLSLTDSRKRLSSLEKAESQEGQLEPFCFLLKQALRKHIRRLEGIVDSRKKRGSGT